MNHHRAKLHEQGMLEGAEYYRRLALLCKKYTKRNAERAAEQKAVAVEAMRKALHTEVT